MTIIPVMSELVTEVSSLNAETDFTPFKINSSGRGRYSPRVFIENFSGASLHYTFSSNTSATDPLSGNIKFNSAPPSTVTEIYVSNTSKEFSGLDSLFTDLEFGDLLCIRQRSNKLNVFLASISDVPVDNTGWYTLKIVSESSGNLPDNGRILEIGIISLNSRSIINSVNTIAVPSTSFTLDASKGLVADVLLTDNTRPNLAINVKAGSEIKYMLKQDAALGGKHVNWDNFVGDINISKEVDAVTTVSVQVLGDLTQQIVSSVSDKNLTQRVIRYPASSFTSQGGGATNIWDRVVTDGVWSWDDVRKYEYCHYGDIQFTGSTYNQSLKDKLHDVVSQAPTTKVLSFCRYDLWWFFNESGIIFPERAWGHADMIGGQKPTAAMGDDPGTASPGWVAEQAVIEAAGYARLTGDFDDITVQGTLLTSPGEIALENTPDTPGGGTALRWWCRNNMMNFDPQTVNGEAWLQLYTDFIVAQRQLEPSVKGYFVSAQKLQNYSTNTVTIALSLWINSNQNPSWVLTTDSGGTGTQAEWSLNGGIQEPYGVRNQTLGMVDVYDAGRRLIDLLRMKDPGALIMYEPYNGTVTGWRNSVYRTNFRATAQAKYSFLNTNAEADQYWADLITYCAGEADAVMFFSDDDADDFVGGWADRIRGLKDKWIVQTKKPQDISLLVDQ